MDTKALQRDYGKLTPRERFALLLTAAVRKDTKELTALEATRGRRTWTIPEGFGVAEAFYFVAYTYMITQLERAANILALGYWIGRDEARARKKGGHETIETIDTLAYAAYAFLRRAEAWRAFCAGFGISEDTANTFVSIHCGDGTLNMVESIAKHVAYTEDEARQSLDRAREYLEELGGEPGPRELITMQRELKALRDAYTDRAARFGEA